MDFALRNQKITGQTVELLTTILKKKYYFVHKQSEGRLDIDLSLVQLALVIFDFFRGHITKEFKAKLFL